MKKIRIISFAMALIVMSTAGAGMLFAQESTCKKYSDSESVYQGNYKKPLTISLDVSDCGKEIIINAKSSAGKDGYMFNTDGKKIIFADKDITMYYSREKQLLVVQPQSQVKEYDVYNYNNDDIVRMLKNIPGKCSIWEKCPDKFELYGFVLASLDLPPGILFYKNILAGAWSGMKISIISNRIAKKLDMNGVSEIISKYQPIAEEKLASDVSEGYDAIRVRNNTILVDTPGGSCTGFFAGKNKIITTAHLPEVQNGRQGGQNTNIKIIIPTPGKELPDGKTCGVKRWVANALMDTAILYVDDSCNHTDSLVIENTPGSISRFTSLYAFSPIKKEQFVVPGKIIEGSAKTAMLGIQYPHDIEVIFSETLIAGQSGSPIFNKDGHVIGIATRGAPAPVRGVFRRAGNTLSNISSYR